MLKWVDSMARHLAAPLEYLTATLLFLMMLLTFLDVIGRYLFNAPIFGSAEMIQFLLAGTIFSGLGLVSASDAHICVELVSPKIQTRFPKTQPMLVGLFSVAGLLLIGVELGKMGVDAWASSKATIVLEWPLYTITLVASFFCLLAALIQFLVLLGRSS